MKTSSWIGGLCLALAASLWGGTYVVSKAVMDWVDPSALIWLRYALGVIALGGMGFFRRAKWRMAPRHFAIVVAVGLVGYALSIWAQFVGTEWSTAQIGALITSGTPAFMVIFARLLLGEPITWRRAASVVLATLGVVVMIGVGHQADHRVLWGGLVLLLAAVTWGLQSVLVKCVPSEYSSVVVTAYAMLVALAAMTPVGWSHMPHLGTILGHTWVWLGILYLGVLSTAGAFLLWNEGLRRMPAGSGGVYFFLQPLVGTALGWLVLGETVTASFWVGALLILGGVALVVREPEPAARPVKWVSSPFKNGSQDS
ncbi:DMT family transporter [Alicyclobacillus sendaiensis]|uniref:DMT family transporter n=1 Tax=Alicyclobacillus sendaiensis PA2 TaxID=3029425 RepID=A0ABT6Y1T0_ALISE|nr:DMT family transporter [Alicyclobacillus sendaiensis]MDI9261314.1 DMT family transporter [Alicyclobacillus sendaiensis PA2]